MAIHFHGETNAACHNDIRGAVRGVSYGPHLVGRHRVPMCVWADGAGIWNAVEGEPISCSSSEVTCEDCLASIRRMVSRALRNSIL